MKGRSKPVCEQLIDLIYGAAFVTNVSDQKFISRTSLHQQINRETIETVLRCSCGNCEHQRNGVRDEPVGEIAEWAITSAQCLFALLAYNRCPQLIDGFFEKDHTDSRIEWNIRDFNADQIQNHFWSSFTHRDPGGSDRLADQVQRSRSQFFVPTINDRVGDTATILNFDPETIVPIVAETPIDNGGYGSVYEIEFCKEYVNFEPLNCSIPLVRKEVDLSRQCAQSEELDILLYVKGLKDEHVVRLVSVYKQGNKINYIFPKATTNLHNYLRLETSNDNGNRSSIERDPLWEQMLAMLRVLYRIHSDVYQLSSGKKVKLYHFDLKPANILVNFTHERPEFLLTDFGFSRSQIADTRAVSSRIIGFGGTPAYAPPEIERPHHQRNHRYDVWSIGCILLEICAFVVNGSAGVLALDDARFTNERPRGDVSDEGVECWDDYFWHMTVTGEAELKPEVIQWMSELPNSPNVTSKSTSDFLVAILRLSLELLDVNISQRPDADSAQHKLSMILKRKETGTSVHSSNSSLPMEEPPASFSVGSDELDDLPPVNCKYDEFFDEIKLRLYEDFLGILHLQIWSEIGLLKTIKLGTRNSVFLAAHTAMIPLNRIELHLLTVADPSLRILRLYPHNSKVSAILQSVLLGQSVRSFSTGSQRSLTITALEFKHYSSNLGGKVLPWKASSKQTLSKDPGKPLAVQLWCEKPFCNPQAVERVKPRKGSGRAALVLAKRRIVIFCESALILIEFAKNWRLEKPTDKYTGTSHRLIPTNQGKASRDPSFEVVVLYSDTSGHCKIPLDPKKLTKLHGAFSFECTYLEVEFTSRDDWSVFLKRYQALKKEWKQQYEDLQKELKSGPEELGYGILL